MNDALPVVAGEIWVAPGRTATAPGGQARAWRGWQRLLFRFGFVYLLLFCAATLAGPLFLARWLGDVPEIGAPALQWVGKNVLGIAREIPTAYTGSGDRTIDYVRIFCFAVLALLATTIWSVLTGRRREHTRLYGSLRVLVRFTLGIVMLLYGGQKLFAGQFSEPGEWRLLQPYGDSSRMGLLWTFMGASPAYVVFTGACETLGAALVLFRRTITVGALVLAGVLANIVALNFCYDVPVKLNSTHYLGMSLFLLLPDLRRLVMVLLPVDSVGSSPGLRPRWKPLGALFLKAALIVLMLVKVGSEALASRSAGPRRWYAGVWEVERFVRDGQEVPPLLTDATRWRRISAKGPADQESLMAMNMDGSHGGTFRMTVETARPLLHLMPLGNEAGPAITFTYRRDAPDILDLQGRMGGHSVALTLRRLDFSQIPLVSRRFHWINERPFIR